MNLARTGQKALRVGQFAAFVETELDPLLRQNNRTDQILVPAPYCNRSRSPLSGCSVIPLKCRGKIVAGSIPARHHPELPSIFSLSFSKSLPFSLDRQIRCRRNLQLKNFPQPSSSARRCLPSRLHLRIILRSRASKTMEGFMPSHLPWQARVHRTSADWPPLGATPAINPPPFPFSPSLRTRPSLSQNPPRTRDPTYTAAVPIFVIWLSFYSAFAGLYATVSGGL